MINRRKTIQLLASGVGTARFPEIARAAFTDPKYHLASSGGPKRIIFFMQNQGYEPDLG